MARFLLLILMVLLSVSSPIFACDSDDSCGLDRLYCSECDCDEEDDS